MAISLKEGWTRAKVATCIPYYVKKQRGQRVLSMIATYCPFCGVKYEKGASDA